MSGTLFVVATPVGNLGDLSPRALAILRDVTLIACEDTRRTARLLAHFSIDTPMLSCHKFNERSRLSPVLAHLAGGEDVALVSDGGTPVVSDPGLSLVEAVWEQGSSVRPLPGPSAVAALLSVAGLTADRYVFEGFLPHRGGDRRRLLRELKRETRTVVCFEAPHRIHATLTDLASILGRRTVVLGRELTKIHETLLRGAATEIAAQLGTAPRGEITLAWRGYDPRRSDGDETDDADGLGARWRAALTEAEGDRRAALKRLSRESGISRDRLRRRLDEIDES